MAHDLLTVEEDKVAAAQGWGIHHVYDLEVRQWVIRILPAEFLQHVVAAAKQNHPLPLKALRLLTQHTRKA